MLYFIFITEAEEAELISTLSSCKATKKQDQIINILAILWMGSGYDTSFSFLSGMLTGKCELIFSILPSIHLPPAGIRETLKKQIKKKFPVFPMWLSKTVVKKRFAQSVLTHAFALQILVLKLILSKEPAQQLHAPLVTLQAHFGFIALSQAFS